MSLFKISIHRKRILGIKLGNTKIWAERLVAFENHDLKLLTMNVLAFNFGMPKYDT